MKTLRHALLTLAVLVATVAPGLAQTSLSSTTLAAAVARTDEQINVASTTGIEVNDLVAILSGNTVAEFVRVKAINGTYLSVSRGIDSRAVAHANASTVYHAPESQYYRDDPIGTCTRASELYLPHINRSSKAISNCSTAGVWYRLHEQFSIACYTGPLATHSVDQSCVTIDRDLVITGITYVSKVVESAGTLTVIPRRQQGTEAPASGDALATAISGVSTVAETVTSFTLTTTGSLLLLSSGERLGLDFTDDVAGELLGVLVTFTVAPR